MPRKENTQDGAGNTSSPKTMDKPQEGQQDVRDLFLFMQQVQQETRHRDEEARRWREEDARHRDEETRRWREDDAKRQTAWMEQLVSKLARGRVQEEPQPARREAPTSESMVEGGTTDRRSTTTILGREEHMQMTEELPLDGACTQPNLHAEPRRQCGSSSETADDQRQGQSQEVGEDSLTQEDAAEQADVTSPSEVPTDDDVMERCQEQQNVARATQWWVTLPDDDKAGVAEAEASTLAVSMRTEDVEPHAVTSASELDVEEKPPSKNQKMGTAESPERPELKADVAGHIAAMVTYEMDVESTQVGGEVGPRPDQGDEAEEMGGETAPGGNHAATLTHMRPMTASKPGNR